MLLLKTVHGSRLYGLAHEHSDYDYWEVYANKIPSPAKQIKQTIKGENDVTVMNLSTFMLYAYRSSHQVLDCMFSQKCDVDLIADLRHNFRLNTATFVPLYERTIKSFWMREDLKSKRHAVRLTMQLKQGLTWGRYEPTLNESVAARLLESNVSELEAWKQRILESI